MKNLIFILSLAILLSSCKKEKLTYSITGQLVSCGSTQYTANSYVDLFQQRNGGNYKSEIVATTTTDSEGKFSFTYIPNNNLDDVLILRQSSGNGFINLVEGIPIKNISDFKYYYSGFAYNLVVSLNVQKPYTANDTLYVQSCSTVNPNGIKIPGPFVSGRLFVVPGLALRPKVNYSGNTQNINAGLNSSLSTVFAKDYFVPFPTKWGGRFYLCKFRHQVS